MTPVATRRYDLDDCDAVDTLFRVKLNDYRLRLTITDHPTEPTETWKELNAVQARQWLNEAPEQIEQPSAVVLAFGKRSKELNNV